MARCAGTASAVAVVLALALSACTANAQAAAAAANCTTGCFVVKDYWPYKTCKKVCDPEVCSRGWGAYKTEEVCCSPGVAFPEGCTQRPEECWVVENTQLRTCIQDQRKCLQGYGVYPNETACCLDGAAFPNGCAAVPLSAEPCWVVDTYYPARQCRNTSRLCTKASGVQYYPTKAACCVEGAAFSEGCSTYIPKAPCFVIDTYDPVRACRREADIAACNRGWGVFQSLDVCCAPGAAFSEGCSAQPAAASG